MRRCQRRPASRVTASVLLGLTLLASCHIGTGTDVSIEGHVDHTCGLPIDSLVTSGGLTPTTDVAQIPMLAPDAWMTPGAITSEQIDALRAIPGVEVTAPGTRHAEP